MGDEGEFFIITGLNSVWSFIVSDIVLCFCGYVYRNCELIEKDWRMEFKSLDVSTYIYYFFFRKSRGKSL